MCKPRHLASLEAKRIDICYVEVKKMKYLITLDTPTEVSNALMKNSKEAQKEMKEMMAQLKPEAAYFSTIRRFSIL